jgi:hypothetical protein
MDYEGFVHIFVCKKEGRQTRRTARVAKMDVVKVFRMAPSRRVDLYRILK